MVKMTEAGVHRAARALRGASAVDISAGTSSTRRGLVGAAICPSGRVGAVGETPRPSSLGEGEDDQSELFVV